MSDKQKNLHEFMNDPKNIAKAVEGSMDKRNAVMADTKAEEMDSTLIEIILGYSLRGKDDLKHRPNAISLTLREAVKEIKAVIYSEIAKARTDLLDDLEKELRKYTAKHDIPMRDETLSFIEAARKRIGEDKR